MTRRRAGSALPAILCATVLFSVARPAGAQSADETSARALFGEGRRLADDGQYAAACPKFEQARKLFASAGVLVNLADCYERIGRTASAWTAFGDAAVVAGRTNRAADVAEAKRRQALLEPRLSSVVVRVAHEVPGLTVKRDGVSLSFSPSGVATPVDPGDHEIRADAAGFASWIRSIAAPVAGQSLTVEIPELRRVANSAAPAPPPVVAPAPLVVAPPVVAPPVVAPSVVAPSVLAPSVLAPSVLAPSVLAPQGASAPAPAPALTIVPAPTAPPSTDVRAGSPPAPDTSRDESNPTDERAWIDAAVGPGYATMAAVDSDLVAQNVTGAGPVFSVGAGVRVSFLTLGFRVRDLQLANLDVWEVGGESAFHAHIGATDLYLGLRGGYAFGNMNVTDANGDTTPNVDVTGFNVGAMLGFDSYVSRLISWGLEVNPEVLDVQRPPSPLPAGVSPSQLTPQEQALFEASGLSVGLVFAATAHIGIHF